MENREKVLAVRRMQQFMERRLQEPITLYQLAQAAGYSPFYSARIFKEVTGKTAFEYIRAMRLSAAAAKLAGGDCKVIDVAFDFVFESHEGFTRAFSKEFGVAPSEFRRRKTPLRLFLPSRDSNYYLNRQKGEPDMGKSNCNTVFVQVIDRPERKLILKRGTKATHYFEYCEEVGCEVWDTLSNIKDALYEPMGMWLPDNLILPGTSVYAQGVEMPSSYQGPVPDGFEMISLPACKMMVFQGPPYDDSKFEDAISDLWEVMKTYDPSIYGFEWADNDGPRFQLEPMGYRGYIEARPVRQLNPKPGS
ncbi:AraC family transcriptional regulator [Dehalogenimonas sp. 4OHTPN]|uniref:AraC family transcriptional regulator n=1 Tax=Dehalogenimonas sp. 4OHTPN TaxID=3166643 RepID=A0AAU8GBH6_9CHLR